MNDPSRRQALSSAAKFIVPTVAVFALSEVQVAASGYQSKPKLNNGHHYGNDKPDTHKVK